MPRITVAVILTRAQRGRGTSDLRRSLESAPVGTVAPLPEARSGVRVVCSTARPLTVSISASLAMSASGKGPALPKPADRLVMVVPDQIDVDDLHLHAVAGPETGHQGLEPGAIAGHEHQVSDSEGPWL